jgi:hypothetical protein
MTSITCATPCVPSASGTMNTSPGTTLIFLLLRLAIASHCVTDLAGGAVFCCAKNDGISLRDTLNFKYSRNSHAANGVSPWFAGEPL